MSQSKGGREDEGRSEVMPEATTQEALDLWNGGG